MSIVALSELLGATVRDASGTVRGRVREIAIVAAGSPHPHRLPDRPHAGRRAHPAGRRRQVVRRDRPRRQRRRAAGSAYTPSDGVLLLKRDLLDQQIIDVHGRKVVRVNDVEIDSTPVNSHLLLNVLAVDVGARGAVRRLAKGVVPAFTLRALLEKIPPRVIPWQFVDLLETDPARRVKLKIAYEGLSKMHPADIADIVEDLPPAEREGGVRNASTRKSPPRRSKSSIPTSRSRSSSRSTAIAPPTSSRKWIRTRPPTCSAISPRIAPAKSSRRWSRRSARKSRSSSSSASTRPRAA